MPQTEISNNSIAAILTCHNRKQKTLKCLASLLNVIPDIDIYLCDDGSTDGTSDEVLKMFNHVHILKGDGTLFWNRGMFTAWAEAIKGHYNYYLWLNNDIELYPFFFQELQDCYNLMKKECIVSGMIEDSNQSKILYGGTDKYGKLIGPSTIPQPIYHMNGGVVFVPQCVIDKIGILDPHLHHDLGDVDYGLTAIENDINVICTRYPIASGYENNFCRVRKWNSNIIGRFKKLYSPLGSNPKINFYYRRKHWGVMNAGLYFIYLHVINILPDKIISACFGNRYQD